MSRPFLSTKDIQDFGQRLASKLQLDNVQCSFRYISKLKRKLGKVTEKPRNSTEHKVLTCLRSLKESPFSVKVTTKSFKKQWQRLDLDKERPSAYKVRNFRQKYAIKIKGPNGSPRGKWDLDNANL